MKYSKYFLQGEKQKWLDLATSIGSNEQWIEQQCKSFKNFIESFDNVQKKSFTQITSIAIAPSQPFAVTGRSELLALLLKRFIDGIGLGIIDEARPGIGREVHNIYLVLAEELFIESKYPTDIYTHAVYRKRGTPTTWLSVSDEHGVEDIENILRTKYRSILGSITYWLKQSRRLVSITEVNDRVIFMLTKPIGPKVVIGENRNFEIPGASYTFIVFNKNTNQIGVVSGSRREVGAIHHSLRNKLFKDSISLPRNDIDKDSNEILKALIEKPQNPDDTLTLMSLELKRALLPGSPSLKVATKLQAGIDEAVDRLREHWEDARLIDLSRVDYLILNKRIGVYAGEDKWGRAYLNTSAKNITNDLEQSFLNQIEQRLGGIDIKQARFVVNDYTLDYVLDRLIKEKLVPTDPPLPKAAEEVFLQLIKNRFIARQSQTIRRKCFNCFTESWDEWKCPSCEQETMRIVSEFVKVEVLEQPVMQKLSKVMDYEPTRLIKYSPRKQRKNHPKSVVSIINPNKRASTFMVIVANKKDVEYVETLVEEGFGVITLLDPRMETVRDQLVSSGCSVVGLAKSIAYVLNENEPSPFETAIDEQESKMLERIISNARIAVTSIRDKSASYNEYRFETDLKSLANAMVPDVVRLGTEYTGTSVPDGYLRYGSRVHMNSKVGTRLFGWDAKYSATSSYRLGTRDTKKQKQYINWLMDKTEAPSQFGTLGIYAIITNFTSSAAYDTTLKSLSQYSRLPRNTRIALVEDLLFAKIVEWSLENWDVVLDCNSKIADVIFKWLRRKQKRQPYTISKESDWKWLKPKLDRVIANT